MLFWICILSWSTGEPGEGCVQGLTQPVLQMELESTGPSIPAVIHDEDGNIIDSRDPSGEPIQFVFEEITWQQEIPWEEAARRLEVAMYPFKKVRKGLGSLGTLIWGRLSSLSHPGTSRASRVQRPQPEQRPEHWEGVPGHLGSRSSTGRSKASMSGVPRIGL